MEELLQHLEKQIKKLIEDHHHLHHSKFLLAREKDLLLVKQQKVIAQIKTLVSKLKTLENADD